jgi:hypothetical protein
VRDLLDALPSRMESMQQVVFIHRYRTEMVAQRFA